VVRKHFRRALNVPVRTRRAFSGIRIACMKAVMRYRVIYRKRFNREGEEADAPQTFLNVADGVVLDSEFVEQIEPPNLHVEDAMEEDDDFLSFGSEIWEYDVADGRDQEFKDAVLNSKMAMELERVEDIEDMPAASGQ
jgi:hypothetical protein